MKTIKRTKPAMGGHLSVRTCCERRVAYAHCGIVVDSQAQSQRRILRYSWFVVVLCNTKTVFPGLGDGERTGDERMVTGKSGTITWVQPFETLRSTYAECFFRIGSLLFDTLFSQYHPNETCL